MKKITFSLIITLFIYGCGSDKELDELEAPTEFFSFEEAKARYEALQADQSGLTRSSGFPTTGTAVYEGIHGGSFFAGNSTSETAIEYYAMVAFVLDYEAGTFTGTLSNFRTNLEGYESPEGELNVSGSIRGNDDLGGDEFGLRFRIQDDELVQNERVAVFDGRTESKGRFTGTTGERVGIRTTATFTWTSGPDGGTVSGAIGFMLAVRQD